MNNDDLPVKSGDDFLAEAERMDLSDLKDKKFLVAISNGDRNKSKFVSTSVRGPFTFAEMVQDVGDMWRDEQHHAKVILENRDRKSPIKTLDENTVDYIECHYIDIITDAMLEGSLGDDQEFTCRPGIVEFEDETPKKVEEKSDATEQDPLP
jgi:hypothetical protein